jgi:hypothetical protein
MLIFKDSMRLMQKTYFFPSIGSVVYVLSLSTGKPDIYRRKVKNVYSDFNTYLPLFPAVENSDKNLLPTHLNF